MRNCYHSTDQYKKSYRGADGCDERTTILDLIVFHYDHGDALLMERVSQFPLPVQLLTVFLSLCTRCPALYKRDYFSDVFEVCKL